MWEAIGIIGSAALALIGTIVGLYYKHRNSIVSTELRQIKSKMRYDIALSFQDWTRLYEILERLKQKSSMDRFLILLAENGAETDLKITSVKWEWHVDNLYKPISMGAVDRYINVVIESPYLKMLKISESTNELLYYDVDKMEDCQLKSYYENEMVKHSVVAFNKREVLRPEKHLVLYYSMSTHRDVAFTKQERTEFELAKSRLNDLNFIITEIKEYQP